MKALGVGRTLVLIVRMTLVLLCLLFLWQRMPRAAATCFVLSWIVDREAVEFNLFEDDVEW